MADTVPERTWQPARWTCIGTFDRMETSFGAMGPGKIYIPAVVPDDEPGTEDG